MLHYALHMHTPPPHHNRFTALFPGPPGWAAARRELLDLTVQGKISRGRHTDHPAGHHAIRTNQCPPPPSPPPFLQARCPSCRPTNSVKAYASCSKNNSSDESSTGMSKSQKDNLSINRGHISGYQLTNHLTCRSICISQLVLASIPS